MGKWVYVETREKAKLILSLILMGNIQLCRFLLSKRQLDSYDSFLEFYIMATPQRGGGTLVWI